MKTRRLKSLLPLVMASALLFMGGCASGPDVRVEYDASTRFTQYRTFGFVKPLGTDRDGYQSILSQRLMAATQRELEARGVRYAGSNPQLLVNFNAAITDKVQVSTVPSTMIGIGVGSGGHRGYYDYRVGMYGAWPLYQDPTLVSPYREGTLNIDIIDAARKQLVWEGVVTDIVTQKMLDNLQASIDAAVTAAFAKYPVQPVAKPK